MCGSSNPRGSALYLGYMAGAFSEESLLSLLWSDIRNDKMCNYLSRGRNSCGGGIQVRRHGRGEAAAVQSQGCDFEEKQSRQTLMCMMVSCP